MSKIPNAVEFAQLEKMTQYLVASGYYTVRYGRDDVRPIPFEQAMAKVIRGFSLGLDPASALEGLVIVSGKLTMSSDLVGALMKAHGYDWKFAEKNDKVVAGTLFLRGQSLNDTPYVYTIEDAERAGHLAGPNKYNWGKYPAEMLVARWKTGIARALAPDVFVGSLYTADELGAAVDEDGNAIEYATAYTAPNVTEFPAKSQPAATPAPAREQTESDVVIDRIREQAAKVSSDNKEKVAWVLGVVRGLAEENGESVTLNFTTGKEMLTYLQSLDLDTLNIIEQKMIDSFKPAKPSKTAEKAEAPKPTVDEIKAWTRANDVFAYFSALHPEDDAAALEELANLIPEGIKFENTKEGVLKEIAKLPEDDLAALLAAD